MAAIKTPCFNQQEAECIFMNLNQIERESFTSKREKRVGKPRTVKRLYMSVNEASKRKHMERGVDIVLFPLNAEGIDFLA